MQPIDVPAALGRVTSCGGEFKMLETSFFLSRQTLIAASQPGMPIWREKLFAWMLRNSESAMEYFRLPTNRVVELGSQVRSEEHTSELQSLMRISYAVFCLKKKNKTQEEQCNDKAANT